MVSTQSKATFKMHSIIAIGVVCTRANIPPHPLRRTQQRKEQREQRKTVEPTSDRERSDCKVLK